MKVLMLNGSGRVHGNTNHALKEIGKQLEKEGVEWEIFQMGGDSIRDCVGCGKCTDQGCVFNEDGVNEFVAKAKEADGLIFGSPVYYAHPSGRIQSFLDRVFYSSGKALAFKPAASVAVCRRGGASAAFDVLNKYFSIAQMPIVGSTYWNLVYGSKEGEAQMDEEGMQTMRNLARNMVWVMRCLEAGKAAGVPLPETERGKRTNFIR